MKQTTAPLPVVGRASKSDSPEVATALLTTSCAKIPRVGPKLLEKLNGLGIYTYYDLLWHLPRDYEDRRILHNCESISQRLGQVTQLELRVRKINHIPGSKPRLLIYCQDATLEDSMHPPLALVFFKPARHQLLRWQVDQHVRVFGEVSQLSASSQGFQLIHPEVEWLDPVAPSPLPDTLSPRYPSIAGIHQKHWQRWLSWCFEQLTKAPFGLDALAPFAQQLPGQLSIIDALARYHAGVHVEIRNGEKFMNRAADHVQRLVLEELISFSGQYASPAEHFTSQAIGHDTQRDQAVRQAFDHQLTSAQERCIAEIYADLSKTRPMMRLLQGDVGSGKTLVAVLASAQVVAQGLQVAVMAPTEILARQHLTSFRDLLSAQNIRVELLTGRLPNSQRQAIQTECFQGQIQILVGTHALFGKHLRFQKLGLMIIDEQHRFGVNQRLALLEKGASRHVIPHRLMMTATPIPRTLTMSLYAKLATSTIDELPPNRKPVTTRALGDDQRQDLIERLKQFLNTGQQAFWVCPLIEESETSQNRNSIEQTLEMLETSMAGYSISLLHGRLKEEEKSAALAAFVSGTTHILLATSMVEVGVNIPNANLMIVENAQFWGLSQLHQLRGRVGRGNQPGFMVLLHQTPLSKIGYERLNVLRESSDGFYIADKDLELRGPGRMSGLEQSGHLQFKLLDLQTDQNLFPLSQQLLDGLQSNYPGHLRALLDRRNHTRTSVNMV